MDNIDRPYPLITGQRRYAARVRLAVSSFYFGQGLAFASWASRIPDIKNSLGLNDAQFGSILFALPLGQLITMPLSGQIVTRFGSKKVLIWAAVLYVFALCNLGLALKSWQLFAFLFLFGIVGNLCNIAVNTQGVAAEKLYARPIMTAFHGAWSVAGFTGALIGLGMVNLHITPYPHFWMVAGLVILNIIFNHKYLISKEKPVSTARRKVFVKPQGVLILLGIIGFCSMATEGAMFDWSGVYFKEVVHSPRSLVLLGYACFMVMMSAGRFVGDGLIVRFGHKRLVQMSGFVISTGMFISVFFPYIFSAAFGFMLTGLGVSAIVPTVYSLAGKNGKVPPGIALAMVSSVSYLGFLIGPPLIGYISGLFNLRYSYALIACFGLLMSWTAGKIKPM